MSTVASRDGDRPVTPHLLHGYRLTSDVGLHLPTASEAPVGAPGLDLRAGCRRPVPGVGPPGEVLAELADDGRRTHYRFVRTHETVVLRFHGTADIVADHHLTEVTVHVDPAADPGLVPVLATGPLIATRLLLDGHLVLHASAVQVGDGALAFCGSSGMGKSTMAALALAAGWAPLADDVLRVDLPRTGPPAAWPGSTELRLRESARSLADASPHSSRGKADGRIALATGTAPAPHPVPLHCCVVPLPDRGTADPDVRLLDPFSALRRLLRFPRIVGWRDPRATSEQFHHLATLCERAPVVEARLPWGPPFPVDLFPRLLDRLEQALTRWSPGGATPSHPAARPGVSPVTACRLDIG